MAKQTFTTGQVLTAAQMTSLQQTAMGGGAATAKTADYVLVATDAGTTVAMDAAGATTITVNTGLFAAGDTVFIQNLGAGDCTITAGTATVATAGSLILPQNDAGILYFTSASASIFYDYIQVGATSPLTTKGDLYTFGTSDTRLPVGTDGHTLVADSSTATGLAFAAPAAAAAEPLLIPINSGKFVKSFQIAALNQAGVPENVTHYSPIFLPSATFDRIGFKTGASQSSSSTVRLGIYNVGANNKPTTLVLDAGTVAANAGNTVFLITINQALTAGYYYLALNRQNANQLFAMFISDPVIPTGGYADNMNNQGINSQMYVESGISGAFTTAGSLSTDNLQLFMGMRLA